MSVGDDVIRIVDPTDETASAARCRRCHRSLEAPRSVVLGIGPVCRVEEAADLISEVFEEVLAAG
jgi:hypothetical protein